MNLIEWFVGSPLVGAMGWALLHFIWQGALVALATALGLVLIRNGKPRTRYALMGVGLGAMALLPIATTLTLYPWSGSAAFSGAPVGGFVPGYVDHPQELVGGSDWFAVSPSLTGGLSLLPLVWLAGVLLFAIRLVGGWALVSRVRLATPPLEPYWQARLQALCVEMGIRRRVLAFAGAQVGVPMVAGILRPVILLPLTVLSGLPAEQVEAILRHELAHLRRWDNLVNGLQVLVETLLFYHPAVWWLSGRMRAEREYCCDDQVVRLSGDPLGYAQALTCLEELRSPPAELSVAANGGSLLVRIQRLLVPRAGKRRLEPAAAALGVMILCIVAMACYSTAARTSGQASRDAGSTPLVEAASERQALMVRVGVGDTLQLTSSPIAAPAASRLPADSAGAISVTRQQRSSGETSVEWAAVLLSDLEERLAQLRARTGDALIVIQGDARVPHLRITQIMDIARRAGYIDQVIATPPKQTTEGKISMQRLEPLAPLQQSRAFGLRLETDGSWSLGGRVSVGADTVWHVSGRTLEDLAPQFKRARLVAGDVSLIFTRVQEGVAYHDVARAMKWAAEAGFIDQVVTEDGKSQ